MMTAADPDTEWLQDRKCGDRQTAQPKRERAELYRNKQDKVLAQRIVGSIARMFPGCPRDEARAIAAHATLRGSGRVGRTAAGRAFDEEALTAAVVASIRHRHTEYDRLLMEGYGPREPVGPSGPAFNPC
ncbi:MAG: DUF2293 domain-containing protein [Acidobacteriales bacterium]|nr:DUF2293 domain-containing protein [Terriglobales bacterium]